MVKVITYGTYDVLHYGHIRLLERAKALGDYLIVGITSDDYDKSRGKINNQQSLAERIQNVKNTGLADEIVIEEYEGQKIDDIKRLGIDIFTVGSDWEGKFDYLNEYCKVVYLPRTEGISSTEVRARNRKIRLGIVGKTGYRKKVFNEAKYVNGIEIVGVFSRYNEKASEDDSVFYTGQYEDMLDHVDAVYILSEPKYHQVDVKKALEAGKHVLCESPITLDEKVYSELHRIAAKNHLVLMDAIKTAYSTAFERLVLLAKSGKIGEILSVDATCTSQADSINQDEPVRGSLTTWGPFAMLPVFQLLGTDFSDISIATKMTAEGRDVFTKIDFLYPHSVASIKVASGAKSEGELIVTGTLGYIYVPAPWWKTDYFEIRYEDQEKNKRFFYQLDGEGIRNELVSFVKSIEGRKDLSYISPEVSLKIVSVMDAFNKKKNIRSI